MSRFASMYRAAFGMGRSHDRHLIDHLEVVSVIDKGVGLLRIVGQQPDLREPQVFEDLQADPVITRVGAEAQRRIGLTVSSPSS